MLFLAIKHLTSRKRQTILTLIGVSLGTAVFIVFSAIMTGMQTFIIDQLVNNDSHVRIQAQDNFISSEQMKENLFATKDPIIWLNSPSGRLLSTKILNPLGWYERLNRDSRVHAYSPQLQSQVIYFNSGVSQAGRLTGIKAATQSKVSNIEDYMLQGSIKMLSTAARRLVIGQALLKKMGARVGDSILVASGGQAPAPFKIVGVYETGVKTIDETMGFAHISDVQQVSGRPSEVSDIVVRLIDVELAREFAEFYTPLSPDKVMSWDQANAGIMSVFTLQNLIRSFISVSIMVVAAFGIYNILSILVNQKRKDIGILRSMGYDQQEILRLFLMQGIFLGFIGGILGLSIGYLMSYGFSLIQINGMINKMTVNFSLSLYTTGFGVALLSAIVSSILPARSASRLKPIDIVRSSE